MFAKIADVYSQDGVLTFGWRAFSYIYKKVLRPLLPDREAILYSGVIVGYQKLGDSFLAHIKNPPLTANVPNYEEALTLALRANVRKGDKVVIVGGGLGVTTTLAALASQTGRVICFEGDKSGVDAVMLAARRHDVANRISVIHAIVGADIGVYGDDKSVTIMPPNFLPECDVLELDCEGAEIMILKGMSIRPRVLIIETHGFLGAETSQVAAILVALGYKVTDLGWAEPRVHIHCQQNDIRALLAIAR